jgi:hypothetical protein
MRSNHCRLSEPIGNVPPPEFEQAYYRLNEFQAMAAWRNYIAT